MTIATTGRTVTEMPPMPITGGVAKAITEIPPTLQKKERDIRKQQLRVAAYCRVSTDSEEQLNSCKSQIDYYTSIIDENPNWTSAGIFPDEGLTGVSTKKREQFNRMIRKCRAGRIDLVITKSTSRFARNTLDSLKYVRMLKKLGVGVLFEKEGINTLEMEDETILTIFASLAQAESESLSKNVAMGYRQSFKAGKVTFRYKTFLGYREGADGRPEIVPEEAAVVKRIFCRYLAGDSVAQICRDLEADGIQSKGGCGKWFPHGIRYILQNEKYVGDALLQKTYVFDMLTRTRKKNDGVLPQYYITGNHAPLLDRDIFDKAQEEIARRGCKRKTPSPAARTERSKYSGKYALNEILVCGECGAPYRRVTWALHGKKRIVWRCVSRLEHGKKFCRESPTLHEAELHAAIMRAINDSIEPGALMDALMASALAAEQSGKDALGCLAAGRRLEFLGKRFDELLTLGGAEGDEEYLDRKLKDIIDERKALTAQIAEYEAAHHGEDEQSLSQAKEMLESETLRLTEYDDRNVRQLIDTIRVIQDYRLEVTFKGGDKTVVTVERKPDD